MAATRVDRRPHRNPGPALARDPRAQGARRRRTRSRSTCRSSPRRAAARCSPTSTATPSSTSSAASAASTSATRIPDVVAAAQEQMARFSHTDFTIVPYEVYIRLAERLARRSRSPGRRRRRSSTPARRRSRTPIKFARSYTGRPAVIAFEGGFHGRTLLSLSLTSKTHPYKAGLGPFAPEVYRVAVRPRLPRPQRRTRRSRCSSGRDHPGRRRVRRRDRDRVACRAKAASSSRRARSWRACAASATSTAS